MYTGGHGHLICMGNLRGVIFQENTPEGRTDTHKSSFFPYRQVSGRNCDHEWLRITNAFILYDLVWEVQKSHATNREGSFKLTQNAGHTIVRHCMWRVKARRQNGGRDLPPGLLPSLFNPGVSTSSHLSSHQHQHYPSSLSHTIHQ